MGTELGQATRAEGAASRAWPLEAATRAALVAGSAVVPESAQGAPLDGGFTLSPTTGRAERYLLPKKNDFVSQ